MDAPLLTALKVSAIGIFVVFCALILVGGVIGLLRRLEPEEPEPLPQADRGQVPEEIVAVISAAVLAALGPRFKVKHIRYGQPNPSMAWSEQGRITIMASHITRSPNINR